MTNFIRLLSGTLSVNVFKSDAVKLVDSDLPRPLINVRQNAASVKVPELHDEPLEESQFSRVIQQLVDRHHALSGCVEQVPSPRPA